MASKSRARGEEGAHGSGLLSVAVRTADLAQAADRPGSVAFAVLLVTLFLLALCAQARAALVFERTATSSIVAARDDGSDPHFLVHGRDPTVSPDARWVAYFGQGAHAHDLYVVSVSSRRHHLLVRRVFGASTPDSPADRLVWSSDSRRVLDATGDRFGVVIAPLSPGRILRVVLPDLYAGAAFDPRGSDAVVATAAPHAATLYLLHSGHVGRQVAAGDLPVWGRAGLLFATDAGITVKRNPRARGKRLYHQSAPAPPVPVACARKGQTCLLQTDLGPNQLKAVIVSLRNGRSVTLTANFAELDGVGDGGSVLGAIDGNVVTVNRQGAVKVLAQGAKAASWTK